ncbi:hypothetical protein INR49_032789 [Caranx melampygus]|nr:hypothetical protein INR49_032789 [Caranx melampygus]
MELWSSHMASFQPRFGQNMDVIMVVGGVSEGGDYLSECVGYFIYEDRWVNLPHIHNHLDGHAIAATESHVYVAGSMEPGFAKTVERYNPNRNTWEQVSNLTTRKHSFGLTCIKDILYSIGGHGNFSPGFKDVSVYEPEQDKWHNLESAPKILRDVKAVSVEDRYVYVTARTPVDTDNEDGLKTVTTRYDTESRQWQDVDSLPLIDNYCIFQMAVASTNFYHTASCCPKSYTVRDEVARQKISVRISDEILESLPPEVTSIEGAAICHFDEDVFIIGGWKNSDDVDKQYRKEAYRYCAERKRWMLLPPMPQPRCRATACHVRIPYRFLYGCQRYPCPRTWPDSEIACSRCSSCTDAPSPCAGSSNKVIVFWKWFVLASSEPIPELSNPSVCMKDPKKVQEILESLSTAGSNTVQVISDFDMTLTRFAHNGKRCPTCHNILDNSKLISEECKEQLKELLDTYYPIEIDSSRSIDEKLPLMVEWWTQAHNLLVQQKIRKDLLATVVRESEAMLRRYKLFFDHLHEHSIPLLIFSAGIGDILEEVIRQAEREGALLNTGHFQELRARPNVLLMGDSLGDLTMADGVQDMENILKIGFLNDKVEERMQSYMDSYDIVLVQDETLDVPNAVLLYLTGNNELRTDCVTVHWPLDTMFQTPVSCDLRNRPSLVAKLISSHQTPRAAPVQTIFPSPLPVLVVNIPLMMVWRRTRAADDSALLTWIMMKDETGEKGTGL